jgi:hypothetical protein
VELAPIIDNQNRIVASAVNLFKGRTLKKLLISLATCAVIGAAIAQTSIATIPRTGVQLGPLMTQNNLSWEDAAVVAALSQSTGMLPTDIIGQRGTSATPYYDLAPGYVIAAQTRRPVADIMQLHAQGALWLAIAQNLSVDPFLYDGGGPSGSSMSDQAFVDGVWRHILTTQYAMSPDDYNYFVVQKYPMSEVLVAGVYAHDLSRPVRDVYTMYSGNSNKWPAYQGPKTAPPAPVVSPPPPTFVNPPMTTEIIGGRNGSVTNRPPASMTTSRSRTRSTLRARHRVVRHRAVRKRKPVKHRGTR